MIKLWLRRIHLLLALFSAVFLISSSITGVLLIYAKELQQAMQPDYWQVTAQSSPLPLAELLRLVDVNTGQGVSVVMPEDNAQLAWQLQLENKQYVSVDPYDGEVLLVYDYYQTFYGFLLGFHRWLLYQNAQGEYPLQDLVSIATLCLLIELCIGFYLWLRPKHPLKRLKINRKAKSRVLFYQLHTVIGVYVLLPLALIAFSGMAFHWQTPTAAIVETLTFGEIEHRPTAPKIAPQPVTDMQLNAALKNAQAALSAANLYRIYMPQKATESMALRMQMPGESHAYSWVWVNPYSAQVLQVYDGSQASFATQVWNFRYKFHIGDFAGPLVQLLWLGIGLSPLFFVLSGLYLWLKRHKKQIAIKNHSH